MQEELYVCSKEDKLIRALKEHFGFNSFKRLQRPAIESILAGKDTLVIMPTGGGKSLCYQLPALLLDGITVVISPLIALMKNQVDLIRSYNVKVGVAHFLNSSLTARQQQQVIKDVLEGTSKLLYLAPETLAKEEVREVLRHIKIAFVAVDEAHCISEWGHDFRPEYRQIRPMIDSTGQQVPIMALTATATQKVREDIIRNLRMRNPIILIDTFNRPNLYYEVRPKPPLKQQIAEIVSFIRRQRGRPGLIYCMQRRTTVKVAKWLKANGIRAEAYHAGLPPRVRNRHQDMFMNDELQVMVATIAFGLGIDKPDIRFVIHFDFPRSLESYYQETGRAGRDGLPATCIAYFSYRDLDRLETYLRTKPYTERNMGLMLLDEVRCYAETGMCRRKYLLHYFGEEFREENCNNCDNCLNPVQWEQVSQEAFLLLSTLRQIERNNPTIAHLIDILLGRNSYEVKQFEYFRLKEFGKGAHREEHFWQALLRRCMILGLVERNWSSIGAFKLTQKGQEFFSSPSPIEMPRARRLPDTSLSAIVNSNGSSAALDPTLYEMLRELRKKVAKEHGVPPFVVFQDQTLEEMATFYPLTVEELTSITGVNMNKAQKFGKPFIELIKKYVEEHEIERPTDIRLKQAPRKSKKRISIIQFIDRKMPLEEVARLHRMSMDQLIDELEAIVLSGNKVDIKYYLQNHVDDTEYIKVWEALRTINDPTPQTALRLLKPQGISERTIRLVRIQFLSEVSS